MEAAYLGPAGSYTELALLDYLPQATPVPEPTISDVFRAVGRGKCACGFVPLENLIQGPVSETFDQLTRYKNELQITASYTMEICHCLGVPAGADPARISAVHSHEQALRQCSEYLRESFPDAALISADSTGAAAAGVREQKAMTAAVIAAESTLAANGFTIIARDIANEPGNKTRFALIEPRRDGSNIGKQRAQAQAAAARGVYVCSIAIDPGKDRQGLLYELMQVISVKHGINLLSIHSRPDRRGGFIFHLDLEGSIEMPEIRDCIADLHDYCSSETGSVAEIILCGSYWQERFFEPPLNCIGIIGSAGVMGRWFRGFFSSAGLNIKLMDQDDGSSLEELCRDCDVLLLSIPMSAFPALVPRLVPHLRPGHLVVENCSVKSSALPLLCAAVPDGVEVLGIHTMFGGDVAALKNENIIITRTDSSAGKSDALEALFYKHGANISHVSSTEHDRRTAFVQALVHCTMLALAQVMSKSFQSPADLEPFLTPNSRAVLSVMERVARQSEDLTLDLQTLNAEYPKARRQFLQAVFNLISALENKNLDHWRTAVSDCRRFFAEK